VTLTITSCSTTPASWPRKPRHTEMAHHGSRHPNKNWEDKYSHNMLWKPPIHLSKLKNMEDFMTACFGPKGPSSGNIHIKITKKYWVYT